MRILGSTEKKEELVLVFDVSSSSVGGAIFKANKNSVPKIIYSTREPIRLNKDISFESLSDETLKSIEKVAGKISTSGLGTPVKVFCVLSSPWYMSETRNISLSKNTPFIFNKKLADSLIQKEVNIFEQECKKKYMDSGTEIVPLEFKNIKITLNGYETEKPLNQKVTELEMTVFISVSGKNILDKMKDTLGRHFYAKNIVFSSFVMSSFGTVSNVFINQKDFLLVDVGGEVTDISMVKKDVLCSSVSFPHGENFLIRQIASTLGFSLEEAVSLLALYKSDHMSDSSVLKIEPIIKKLKNEWLIKFQEALTNISNDISIPSTIFLTVDQRFSDFFTDTIKSEQFSQYILTESKFNIVYLGNQAFSEAISFGENIERDSLLAIESIYINRFLF